MPVALLPGSDVHEAIRVLGEYGQKASNLRTSGEGATAMHADYLVWARNAADRLRNMLTAGSVDELVLTRTYWALLAAAPLSGGPIFITVQSELEARVLAFERAQIEIEEHRRRWSSGFGDLVVLDTGVFIEHEDEFPDCLVSIEQRIAPSNPGDLMETSVPVQFVIPLKVVDQLDATKADRARGRASLSLARLNDLLAVQPQAPVHIPGTREGTLLQILMDDPEHERLPDADAEIVDRALYLAAISGRRADEVSIACFDTGMRLRARMAGLGAHLLPDRRPEGKSRTG